MKSTEAEVFRVLEEKHVLKTIRFLHNNGPASKKEIYAGVSDNPRMPEKLLAMKSIGLLKDVKREENSRAQVLALTEKGERVAVELEKILSII